MAGWPLPAIRSERRKGHLVRAQARGFQIHREPLHCYNGRSQTQHRQDQTPAKDRPQASLPSMSGTSPRVPRQGPLGYSPHPARANKVYFRLSDGPLLVIGETQATRQNDDRASENRLLAGQHGPCIAGARNRKSHPWRDTGLFVGRGPIAGSLVLAVQSRVGGRLRGRTPGGRTHEGRHSSWPWQGCKSATTPGSKTRSATRHADAPTPRTAAV